MVEGERLVFVDQDLWQWLVHSQHLLLWVDYLTTASAGGGREGERKDGLFSHRVKCLKSVALLTGQAPSQPVLR